MGGSVPVPGIAAINPPGAVSNTVTVEEIVLSQCCLNVENLIDYGWLKLLQTTSLVFSLWALSWTIYSMQLLGPLANYYPNTS